MINNGGHIMKYLKFLLIILLIFSFAMVSCKKDSTTGPTSSPIVGTWNVVDMVWGLLLTTNSNQVATAIPGVTSEINITANTPTFVQFLFDDDDIDAGISTINFKNDGTGTVTTIDDYGTENEDFTYTTDGDQITVNEDGEITVFEYSIDGNTLTLTISEDWCEGEIQAECFADTEQMFDFTSGSVTAASMQIGITFNQATAKQGLNVRRSYDLFNPSNMVKDYKLKMDNLKKNL